MYACKDLAKILAKIEHLIPKILNKGHRCLDFVPSRHINHASYSSDSTSGFFSTDFCPTPTNGFARFLSLEGKN